MDQRTRVIIIGAIALFVIAAVLAGVVFVGRLSKNQTPKLSDTGDIPDATARDLQIPTIASRDPSLALEDGRGTFTASNYSLKYPTAWSVLTCSNSKNFELDPTSAQDIKNVVCDVAVKPVTIMEVSKLNCQGEKVTIGSHQVTKSKATQGDYTRYTWCLNVGSKNLEITHRVSPKGERATSKEDYSQEVEEVIESIQATPQGS
ncbi:MAG: hypothetical protein Q7S88_02610 [Candidatus Daviesbacteria bacterium]|nr:hypothetical protein [Candidatus Daviesbacteria bacterium]